ncbi:beta-sesquiphellandrene synthase-like [Oryza brachyantha]|uniref:beta-sesquiphellandrene synthase-like n=1 Tax=Oryza brachyantha TaxID=4533 RepID=UPI001AD95BE6|nr:beta-sesquiphellandrene synthase-like [Oryza brachyantha]
MDKAVPTALPDRPPNGEGQRRSPDFHPSLWGDFFLNYEPPSKSQHACMKLRAEMLREEVRTIIKSSKEVPKILDLILAIQRLGLDIYYKNEINDLLHFVYSSDYNDKDLNLVSLRFYLLRKNGYNISSGVFLCFKDNEGNFAVDDTRSLLSLYNAAALRVHGERVLDEAATFSINRLKRVFEPSGSMLSMEVLLAIEEPIFRRARIVEMRNYIPIYEIDATRNETILEFAKLNFNLLQLLYCGELNNITLWWKELKSKSNLSFSRDRIVEMYFWMNGALYEPHYSHSRIILTRVTAIMTIIDDIFDTYGTTGESMLLAEAINRSFSWDESAIGLLPEYIKGFYAYLLNTFDSFEEELGHEKRYRVSYLKELLKQLVQAYTKELKWRDDNYMPKTLDEHFEVSMRSSGGFTLAGASFVGMDDIETKDILEWLLSYPSLFKSFDRFVRLSNDIVSNKREQTGDHYASTIQCYMKEHGTTIDDTCRKLKELIEDSWKDMIEHCTNPTYEQPLIVPQTVVNFARTVTTMYRHGDAFTSSHTIKEMIASLYVVPIQDGKVWGIQKIDNKDNLR